jgi:hypothetical protein
MPWQELFDNWTPRVFSPKVLPDPTETERLEEKFQSVRRKLKEASQERRRYSAGLLEN